MSIQENKDSPIFLHNNCENRIKSNLLGGVKTEALLVFIRTALERLFEGEGKEKNYSFKNSNKDTQFIYDTLQNLLNDLKKSVVNVSYLLSLMEIAKKNPNNQKIKQLAKYEEPLMTYNDTMARRIQLLFPQQSTISVEFLVICLLSNWFLENEKSTVVYPFIEKYDFLLLIEKFEILCKKESLEKKKLMNKIQLTSIDIIEHLKKVQYKFNSSRKSKKRKK